MPNPALALQDAQVVARVAPLLAAGFTPEDAAAELALELRLVRRAMRSDAGQRALRAAREAGSATARRAAERCAELALDAVDVLHSIALGEPDEAGVRPDAHARIKAADSLLDRGGVPRDSKQTVVQDVRRLELGAILTRLRALGVPVGELEGETVDGEVLEAPLDDGDAPDGD